MKKPMILTVTLLLACFVSSTFGETKGHFPAYLLNCTRRTEDQLKTLNLTYSISSILSLLVMSAILLVSLYYKAYRSTLQRLFLYLIIATLLQLIVLSTTIMHQFQYRGDGILCQWLGFISQYTGALSTTLDAVIALNLLYIVYQSVVRNISKNKNVSRSGHSYGKVLEGVLFFFIAIFPFSYIWFPFYKGGYGFSGISCWITTFDEECNYIGFEGQLLIYSLGLAHDIFAILIAIVIAVIYCSCAYSKLRNPQMLVLMRKTLLLMLFVFIRGLVFAILGVLNRFYISADFSFSVVYATTITPLSLLTIPIGYLIYLFTNNSTRICHYSCIRYLKLKRANRKQDNPHVTDLNQTNPPSTRVSPPSVTQSYHPVPTGLASSYVRFNDSYRESDP